MRGWPTVGALCDGAVPQSKPCIGPRPVTGQVQDGSALGSGQTGGDVDEFASQGGAAGDGVGFTGQCCRGTQQVVCDACSQDPG